MKKIMMILVLGLCACSTTNKTTLIFDTSKLEIFNLPLVTKLESKPLTAMNPEIHDFKIDADFVANKLSDDNYLYGTIKKDGNTYVLAYYDLNIKELVEMKEYSTQYLDILDVNDKYIVYYLFNDKLDDSNYVTTYMSYNLETGEAKEIIKQDNNDLGVIFEIQRAALVDDILYLNYVESDGNYDSYKYVLASFDLNNNKQQVIEDKEAWYAEIIDNKLYYVKYNRQSDISKLMEYDTNTQTSKVLGQASSREDGQIYDIYEVYGKLIVEINTNTRSAIYKLEKDKLVEMFAVNTPSLVAFIKSDRYFTTYVKQQDDIISYIWDLRDNKFYQGGNGYLVNDGECLIYTSKSDDKVTWHYLVNAPYEGKGTYITDKNENIVYDFDAMDGGVDFGNGVKWDE